MCPHWQAVLLESDMLNMLRKMLPDRVALLHHIQLQQVSTNYVHLCAAALARVEPCGKKDVHL